MKAWFYKTGILAGIFLVVLFLPVRWSSDVKAFSVSLGRRSDFSRVEEFRSGDYVLVEDEIDPSSLAREADEKKAYIGAVEFTDGYEPALRAEIFRRKKELFFRAFDPNPKGIYSPDEILAKMRRAVRERSVDLIIIDNVPQEVTKEFKKSFKTVEKPFPHPSIPLPRWPFLAVLLILSASFSPLMALLSLATAFFSFDVSVSVSSIVSTLALYRWTKRNPFLMFLSFLLLGILTNAALSDFLHMNGVIDFRGVKISLILLPLLVILRGLAEKEKMERGDLWVLGLILAGGAYYVFRSGNYGAALPLETKLRDFLDAVFWIRPRFKELLGYVFLFLAFKGDSRWRYVYEFLGSVALVTTFNTFCHVKAPIFTSIYRSFLAFFLASLVYLALRGGAGIAQARTRSDESRDGGSRGKRAEDKGDIERTGGKES